MPPTKEQRRPITTVAAPPPVALPEFAEAGVKGREFAKLDKDGDGISLEFLKAHGYA